MVELILSGHLSRDALDAQLATLRTAVRAQTHADLLVDCRVMTDYDLDARDLFVSWLSTESRRLRRIAIVTDRPLWHLVVSAMALATRLPMKSFSLHDEAASWLSGRDARRRAPTERERPSLSIP